MLEEALGESLRYYALLRGGASPGARRTGRRRAVRGPAARRGGTGDGTRIGRRGL